MKKLKALLGVSLIFFNALSPPVIFAGASDSVTVKVTVVDPVPFVDINPASNPYINADTYLVTGNKSEDADSVTLEVTPDTVSQGQKTYTSTTWECGLSNLTEGVINMVVYCEDAAGNKSPTFSSSIIVDKTPPLPPELTVQTPALTNQPTLSLEGTKEAHSSVLLNSQEAGIVELVPIDRYQRWSAKYTLKEGENHISLASKDYAGNEGAALTLPLITLDTVPPDSPTVDDITSPANNPKCQLSGTKSKGSSIWINNQEAVAVDASTAWSYLFKLYEGKNDLAIYSKDAAGNKSQTVERTVVLNTTPPGFPTIDSVSTPTDSRTQKLTGTMLPDTTVLVECPTADESAVSYPSATTWECTLANLTHGRNRVLVIAVDELGNQTEPIEAVIDYAPLVNITNTTADELNPDIKILNNEFFVIWQDGSDSDVRLAVSSDAGATWQIRADAIGQGHLPKLAVDNSANIFAILGGGNTDAMPVGNGSGIYLVKSTDKGTTFSTPISIGIGYNPAIAISEDGSRVYVVWYQKEDNERFTIQCRASSDGGNDFLPSVEIGDIDYTGEAAPAFGLALATTKDAKYVYCAFPRKYDGEPFWKIAFYRSPDYAETFDAGQKINPEPHNGYNPALAVYGSDVYLLWQHDAYEHHHIWLRRSNNYGKDFSPRARLDDGGHDTTNYKMPAIAASNKGAVYTGFVDATDSRNDIYIDSSLRQGMDFQQDIAIDAGPSSASQLVPQVAVNSTGDLMLVVWQDNRSGNQDIYIRNFKINTPIDWLKSQIGDFGFLDSFEADGKDDARTYDQALAVIALSAGNEPGMAKKVLDALKAKQNSDGSWYSSYNPKTGANTDTEAAKYVGVASWVIAAVNFYINKTKDTSFVEMAKSAAEWLHNFQDTDPKSPTYGSLIGGLLGNAAIEWRSTEHNLDAYSAFKHLQKCLNENNISSTRNYSAAADLIQMYMVAKMWDGSRFFTGWEDDSRFLDAQSLAILALGMRPNNVDIRPALLWVKENFTLQVDWDSRIKGVSGFDERVYYNQAPNKIWTEGTEQMVSAFKAVGLNNMAGWFHKQVLRLSQPNLAIPYSTLGSSEWSRYTSVAATCWFYFNECLPAINPLDPLSANASVLTVDDFNDSQPNDNSLGFYTDDDATCATDEDTTGSHHIVWDNDFAYWYSVLFGGSLTEKDISSYKYLSFKIRSRDMDENFVVRMEDSQNRVDINIKDYAALSGQWQYINIPLAEFISRGFDAKAATSVAFVFNKDASGDVWFDDLSFSGERLSAFANITAPQKLYCRIPAQFSSVNSIDYDGNIVSYEWDFGDNETSSSANPVHIYLVPGQYTVSLKIKDNDGISAFAQKAVTVYEAPLITGDLTFISDKDDDLIYADGIVTISAVTTAVEGEQLEHRFKIDGQIVQDYSSDPDYQWDTRSASLGRHLVEYDVRDEYNNSAHKQAYVWVYRRPIAPPNN